MENSKNIKIQNDLLFIEPLTLKDFGTYSCLFTDKFGEKKIDFKIDQHLVPFIEQNSPKELHFYEPFDYGIQKKVNINLKFSGGLSDGYLRIVCESSNLKMFFF